MRKRIRLTRFLQRWQRAQSVGTDAELDGPAEAFVEPSRPLEQIGEPPRPISMLKDEKQAATSPQVSAAAAYVPAEDLGTTLNPNVGGSLYSIHQVEALKFKTIAHIQNLGDRSAAAGGWAGRASGWGRIEGFTVACDSPLWRDHVTFQAIQDDGSLAPPVAGGAYCGTRGKMMPLYGFVVHVAIDPSHLGGFFYQGVFQDSFRTGLLEPGTPCISPTRAALLALRFTSDPNAAEAPEHVPPAPATRVVLPATAPREKQKNIDFWDEEPIDVSLIVHLAGIGDAPAGLDGWAGDLDSPKPIEGFSAASPLPGWSCDLEYYPVLRDGVLGAATTGGLYCGTRRKAQPLHGFMLEVAAGRSDLAAITYEGIFKDGFRSGALRPGHICASPDKAALVAMRISITTPKVDGQKPSADDRNTAGYRQYLPIMPTTEDVMIDVDMADRA